LTDRPVAFRIWQIRVPVPGNTASLTSQNRVSHRPPPAGGRCGSWCETPKDWPTPSRSGSYRVARRSCTPQRRLAGGMGGPETRWRCASRDSRRHPAKRHLLRLHMDVDEIARSITPVCARRFDCAPRTRLRQERSTKRPCHFMDRPTRGRRSLPWQRRRGRRSGRSARYPGSRGCVRRQRAGRRDALNR
jgi:hypothetical protein